MPVSVSKISKVVNLCEISKQKIHAWLHKKIQSKNIAKNVEMIFMPGAKACTQHIMEINCSWFYYSVSI
jgi:hypothetical protein